MTFLTILNYLDSYLRTLLQKIFPYKELMLINKSNLTVFKLNLFFILLYYLILFVSKIYFFKEKVNQYLSNYNIVYLYNEKYNLSINFIINENKKKELHCTNIKKISLQYNNESILDITKTIKSYSYDFNIIYFFLINNINPKNIKCLVLEYIPIFNIKKKEIPLKNFMDKKIKYILKN